mmetsp:Transcript_15113/g.51004  ORF Transcript_15113/g.51004 Transcript_15113/m.51004 type:complete len:290 (+) Transcript_15113:64-933(+)
MAPPKKVPNEWDPLTPQEAEVLRHCRQQLGKDLRGLPDDLVTMLVRGYATEPDWKKASATHMAETAEFRQTAGAEKLLDPKNLPADREAFERMWRTAIVGEDAAGHTVVYESIGRIPIKEFGARFSGSKAKEELFLAHSAYNKEAMRRWNVKRSAQLGKRVYKMIVVLDLAGMTSGHVGGHFRELLKTYISKFSNLYPESLYKLFVINAPLFFSGVWAMVKGFVHPVTRAKIHVNTDPKYALQELKALGVKLDFDFKKVYEEAPPLSEVAKELQKLPPPFIPPGEDRGF